mgnify:CR=1 FL=1
MVACIVCGLTVGVMFLAGGVVFFFKYLHSKFKCSCCTKK